MRTAWITAGLACLLGAIAWLALAAPERGRLPADYAASYGFDAAARARATLGESWQSVRLAGRRHDTTLHSAHGRSIIQSDVLWTHADGSVLFENAGLYAVDRDDRRNLPGLGNVSRSGQFMFPPGGSANELQLWDAQFVGPRRARLARMDELDGRPVQRWRFELAGLDETAGYTHLPDVPARYRVHTAATGVVLVDPVTGYVLDYHETGRSGFVDLAGRAAGDFFEWSARFDAATRAAAAERVRRARSAERTETLGPAVLAAGGLALLLAGARRARRSSP